MASSLLNGVGAFVNAAFLLILLASLGEVEGYPQYRDEVPNGLRSVDYDSVQVTALGHANGHGGGDLNVFGKAFKKYKYEWSNSLCMDDSDGDGESNGLELGDPCCLWKVGMTPMRQWGLSHPGDEKSKTNLNFSYAYTCVSKKGDESFWKFYFDDKRDFHYRTFSEDVTLWWNRTLTSFKANGISKFNPFGDGEDVFMRSSKDLFTALVLLCTVITLSILVFSHRCGLKVCLPLRSSRVLTLRDHAWIIFAAFVFTDWMSGLLHVVLDNPIMNTWPVVGPEAKAFQGHHYDPTAVARGPWLDFLREHHILVFLVMALYILLKPSSPGLMLFSLHFMWMSHVMMAALRWSHTHPKYLSPTVKAMMDYGIVMTVRHHSAHHASYDCNFCIFSGWMNPLLNQLIHIVHWRSPLWLFILAGFAFVPIWATNKSIQEFLVFNVELPFRTLKSLGQRMCCKANEKGTVVPKGNSLQAEKKTQHFTLFVGGRENNVNTAIWRKRASVYSVTLGTVSTALIAYGLFASGSWKGTGFTRFLVGIHVLCMSVGCLMLTVIAITAYSWNVFDTNDSRWAARKASLRSVHRAANLLSVILFLVGIGAMVLHLWIKEHTLLHDKSAHTKLGLLTLFGILVQVTTGIMKYPFGGNAQKRFTWHGKLGWLVFLAMFFTINSGVAESGFFTNLVTTQIVIQLLLFWTFVTVAFSIRKMPPFIIHLENPLVFLCKEYLDIMPSMVSDRLRRLPFCGPCKRGSEEATISGKRYAA